ncbi:hypothetical protein BHYA_0076g00110 [Botrytis hyacinthi]|uniref:Uncharacterized protein n=1 Tax=Botrytis hyacinthi TaxID=278943 RepID=A0A4Z1GT43_9HELO|nr:hypothetical protein BHYA_0076g00110 [Botrytis hyacinthi]
MRNAKPGVKEHQDQLRREKRATGTEWKLEVNKKRRVRDAKNGKEKGDAEATEQDERMSSSKFVLDMVNDTND